jgi:hypothetical protein
LLACRVVSGEYQGLAYFRKLGNLPRFRAMDSDVLAHGARTIDLDFYVLFLGDKEL